MQTSNRIFDDFAKLLTSAAGAAQGARKEIETIIHHQAERLIAELDLVPREEFEAVRALAMKAREENERLVKRVAALEKAQSPAKPKTTKKTTAKKTTAKTKR